MGIFGWLGLRRSPVKGGDARTRLAAVRALPVADQARLMDVAVGDADAQVRRAAAAKIAEADLLQELTRHPDAEIVALAREKLAGIAVETVKRRPLATAAALLEDITEASALVQIVLQADDQAVRDAAFARLDGASPSPTLWSTIVIQDQSGRFAPRALQRIDRRQALKEVVKKAKDAGLRQQAEERIAAMDAERAKPSPEKQRQERARCGEGLLERLRIEAVTDDLERAEEIIAACRQDWATAQEQNPEAPDDGLPHKVTAALEAAAVRVQERRAAIAQDQAARQALLDDWQAAVNDGVPEDDSQRQALLASWRQAWEAIAEAATAAQQQAFVDLCQGLAPGPAVVATATVAGDEEPPPQPVAALLEEAEALSQRDDWRDADAAFKVLDKRWLQTPGADAWRQRFLEVYAAFKQRRRDHMAQRDEQRSQRVAEMESLVAEAEALAVATVGPEEADARREALRDLQQRWRAIGPVPAQRVRPLRQAFRAACDAAHAPLRALYEAREWERFAAIPHAEALVAEAVALAESNQDHADEASLEALAEAVKDVQKRWKHLGPLPRERRDALWEAFKEPCDRIYERLQPLFAIRDERRVANLAAKNALIAELETQLDDAPLHVGATEADGERSMRTDKIKEIQARWKEIGPVPREHDRELWGRYKALLDRFYAGLRQRRAMEAHEQEENLEAKQALCAQMESLAETVEAFRAGTSIGGKREADFFDDMRNLQAQYRAVGFVPRAAMADLRQRYDAACGRIREALQEWFAARDAERQDNLTAKQAILDELTQLLSEEHAAWFADDVRRLQDRWRAIGPVPREHVDINQRFAELIRTWHQGQDDAAPAVIEVASSDEAAPDEAASDDDDVVERR